MSFNYSLLDGKFRFYAQKLFIASTLSAEICASMRAAKQHARRHDVCVAHARKTHETGGSNLKVIGCSSPQQVLFQSFIWCNWCKFKKCG